jgi:WD40 repeat protein
VANVFISHTGADIGWAQQIHGWLSEDQHSVFLDVDQHDGVRAGEEWRPRLYERLRWADAVICVVTPAYLESAWCAAEIGAAQALGIEILPVRAASEPLDDQLLTTKQYVDVVRDASGGRDRLRLRLSVIDGSGGRGWPDDASPYPGLRSFQLREHRVFFGRGREIKEITERLRSPAERGERAVLTVVGPSGCGKSSLVRAGVLPRIAGGDEWLTVPPIVPGSDPMGNLVRAIASLVRERHIDFGVASLRANLQHSGLKAVATDLLVAAQADSQCKLLIVVDQFEELLTQTEPRDRAAFVETIEPALGGPVQALATMRPEFLDPASKDVDLSKLPPRIQPVRPLAADALREVIEQPAEIAGLSFDDGLVSRLVTDTGSGDALPLLAFTLEQLADGVRRGGQLTHQRYDEIGGVQGALQRQADAALDEACSKTGVTRHQVISALLDLVTIDEQGRPTKRRAVIDELSSTMVNELEPFVDRRLLSTQAEGERTFVGVAHEAFLVNWAPLKDEIDVEVTALRGRRIVENAANDWVASGRDQGTLLQGRQLAKATVDTGVELKAVTTNEANHSAAQARPLATRLSGSRRLVSRVELNDTAREFLEASMRFDRARRRRRVTQVVAVIASLLLVTGAALAGLFYARAEQSQAEASARQAIASRLQNEAADMLAQNKPGGDFQAFQKLLAAHALTGEADDAPLRDAIVRRFNTDKILYAHAGINSVAFSADGHRVATGGDDGKVRLWDAASFTPQGAPLTVGTQRVTSVEFSPDGHRLASVSGDAVRLSNAENGQPLGLPLPGHTATVVSVAFSPDGHRLATGGFDNTVRLWDADTAQQIGAPLTGHTATVMGVAFSPDGHRVASASADKTVRLWNLDTGQQVGAPLTGHTAGVNGVAFSPDGRRLASASDDKTVRLWNLDTGQQVGAPLTGHTDAVSSVAFSPDGRHVASGSFDKTVRVWNAVTGQPVGDPLTGHTDEVWGVAFSPDGRRLASGDSDGGLRIWRMDAAEQLTGLDDVALTVAFSPDGHRVATGGLDGTVRLWDAGTGEPEGAPLTGHNDSVTSVAFSPDGHRLASASNDTTVRLWDVDAVKPFGGPLTGHTDRVTSVAFSPDGHSIASASFDKTVRLWDANTGKPVGARLTGHTSAVTDVAFSPDGRRLASASDDKTVRLWNVDTGQPIGAPLTGHTAAVETVAFSPDGHRLASAGDDRTVRLWDAGTGELLGQPLTGHDGAVVDVAFSPDMHRLASASWDNTVRFWDAETGRDLGVPLTGHTDTVNSVAFSPDGERLVTTSRDRTARFWPAVFSPESLCNKLTTNMNPDQWHEWISDDKRVKYRELCTGLPRADD